MGLRGPAAEPAARKQRKGNPGRRPIGDAPELDLVDIDDVDLPPILNLSGLALEIWKSQTPRLRQLKLLQAPDATVFARYCINLALWITFHEKLQSEELFYVTDTGFHRAHPAVAQMMLIERRLEHTEARFGLTPADRQSLFMQRAQSPIGGLFDQPQSQTSQQSADGIIGCLASVADRLN